MKKRIALLCVATLVFASLTGCGSKDQSAVVVTEEESTEEAGEVPAEVSETNTFTLGFDADFPPYGYMDEDGEYVGFDLDLAEEVCNRLDLELIKQPIDWDSKDMELSSGSIDCIWNGFTMNGREDDYTWSDPYIDNSQVFVVAKDSGIQSLEDLSGKVVDVQAASSALSALEEEENAELAGSFAELIQVPEYNTAFMNLEAGAADAVAMDIGVAQYQIASREDAYEILDKPLASEVYAIGFLLGNEDLRDKVQEQLNAMAEDGTFLEIAEKWGLSDCVVMGK